MCCQKAVCFFPTHSKNGVIGRKAAANKSSQSLLCNSGSWILSLERWVSLHGSGSDAWADQQNLCLLLYFWKVSRELAPPKKKKKKEKCNILTFTSPKMSSGGVLPCSLEIHCWVFWIWEWRYFLDLSLVPQSPNPALLAPTHMT